MTFFQEYKEDQDPSKFKSVKTGRGPLGPDWKVFHSLQSGSVQFRGVIGACALPERAGEQPQLSTHVCLQTSLRPLSLARITDED